MANRGTTVTSGRAAQINSIATELRKKGFEEIPYQESLELGSQQFARREEPPATVLSPFRDSTVTLIWRD